MDCFFTKLGIDPYIKSLFIPKSLSERILQRAKHKKLSRQAQYHAAFISLRQDIQQALEDMLDLHKQQLEEIMSGGSDENQEKAEHILNTSCSLIIAHWGRC